MYIHIKLVIYELVPLLYLEIGLLYERKYLVILPSQIHVYLFINLFFFCDLNCRTIILLA